MYDIRQFHPALYLLVFLGIAGFAMATESAAALVLGGGLVVVNYLLRQTGRLRPLPRFVANLATLLATAWVVLRVTGSGTPIIIVGQFLVILQIVKLFEQRANRDYGQLIVLSLLLMVAAAISTASLAFGVLLAVYLFLSLYCCLLFHLKVETDAATKAMGLRDDRPADLQRLRQDQARLGSSMRRLTAVVSLASVSCAVVIFLIFPRGTGASFLGGQQFKSSESVTGFSGEISFQQIARITQNETPVAYLQLLRDDQPIEGTQSLYLRGNTLDTYVSDPDAADRWTWRRTVHGSDRVRASGGITMSLRSVPERPAVVLEQRVELEPSGLDVLPSLSGAFLLRTESAVPIRFRNDGTIGLENHMIREPFRYTVWSTGRATGPAGFPIESGGDLVELKLLRDRVELMRLATRGDLDLAAMTAQERAAEMMRRFGLSLPNYQLYGGAEQIGRVVADAMRDLERAAPYPVPEAIREFALDPEVSGADSQGQSLAQQRLQITGSSPLDERIARNIERYLRTQYSYTLDLTDKRLSSDQDPLAWFVSDEGRVGHCEYFAGTMALACQALGIPARVVVGFHSDEFNPAMKRYVVRQSHAHAWVEVLTTRGWQIFDPTSGNGVTQAQNEIGVLQQMRQWLEFLEYSWANNVVAYDTGRQENLIQNLERGIVNGGRDGQSRWSRFQEWLESQNLYIYSAQLMAWLIVAMVGVAGLLVLWFLLEQWRLRRRARRIGLGNLPPEQARRLARQLGFYDDLLRLLARHGHERRPSQTPREFAGSLSLLPREAYDRVIGLTEIFYRVRYGTARLTPRRRRWLHHTLDSLAGVLERG